MNSLTDLFYAVDNFCQQFEPQWKQQQLTTGLKQRHRARQLCLSEIMTIVIHFHQSHYRDFKTYYIEHVQKHLQGEFPHLVSYQRFVELMPSAAVPLCAYLPQCFGQCTGISFVDSTPIAVCHNRRIPDHKVFDGLAARGKNSVGWFFGFKLHLVANDRGELLACSFTPGNVDDRVPVPKLVRKLFGKLFGDKGYLSQKLFKHLWESLGVQLITNLRANMKNKLLPLSDKLMLRKRMIMETIADQLKNISQIEHSRHRSFNNFLVNLLSGLIAYCHQAKKPSLHLDSLSRLEPVIPN